MERFQWSDGWLLAVLGSARVPMVRERLNSVGDAFNHAIFTDLEVIGGMHRLEIAGFARMEGELFAATEAGRSFVETHWRNSAGHIDNMMRVIDALCKE
ncbi:hypothetical protein EON81_12280 [bacterium]|nr:MAG: hypothetical protein EON81_12280 [bacterium]